jgi:probable phosphoglycerate mutase
LIILARHGQTEWNKAKRLQGWKNSPLTDLGASQAHNVAKEIAKLVDGKPCEFFSSPLGRAFNTAQIISGEIGFAESNIQVEPLLKELSFGIWEGLSHDDIQAQHPEQWHAREQDKWNYIVPNGESYAIAAKRAEQWLETRSNQDITIAVSHEVIGKIIRGVYLGLNEKDTLALSQNNNEIVLLENSLQVIKAA